MRAHPRTRIRHASRPAPRRGSVEVRETRTHSAAPGRYLHELRMSSPGTSIPNYGVSPANALFGGPSTRMRNFRMEHRPGAGLRINDRYAPFDFNDCPAAAACRRAGTPPACGCTMAGCFRGTPGHRGSREYRRLGAGGNRFDARSYTGEYASPLAGPTAARGSEPRIWLSSIPPARRRRIVRLGRMNPDTKSASSSVTRDGCAPVRRVAAKR